MFRFVRVLLLWNICVVFVEIFWLFEKNMILNCMVFLLKQ